MYADEFVIFLISLLAEWSESYLATQLFCHVYTFDAIGYYVSVFIVEGTEVMKKKAWNKKVLEYEWLLVVKGCLYLSFFHMMEEVYYLRVRRTGIATPKPGVTGRVFQAKTGFVSLSHFTPSNDIQQVIVTEGVHAMVVPLWNRKEPTGTEVLYILLSN